MRRLVCLLALLASLVPLVRAQDVFPRIGAGLAVHTSGLGMMREGGIQALHGSIRVQLGDYLNLAEEEGTGPLAFATDRVRTLLVGVRPSRGRVEYALGVGIVRGSRYVYEYGSGETIARPTTRSGVSLHAEIGSALRRKLGVGVRLMAIASRPLTGVGAALTVGLH